MRKKILKDHSGNGTIYTGNYYALNYQPSRENSYSLKCDGVELVIPSKRVNKYGDEIPEWCPLTDIPDPNKRCFHDK